MTETGFWHLLRYRVLFVVLCGLSILVYLLPFGQSGVRIPAPDLVYLITVAWVLRCPHYAPVLLVGALAFAADIFLQRELGLHALALVIASDMFRRRYVTFAQSGFVFEWASVGLAFFGVLIAEKIILSVTFSTSPGFVDLAFFAGITAVFYPVVVYLSKFLFSVERPVEGARKSRRVSA